MIHTPGSGSEILIPPYLMGRMRCATGFTDALCLVDGVRPIGSYSCNARFVFSVELREKLCIPSN